MTEPKVVRYAVTCHPERIVISEDGAWVQHHDYARLAARVRELEGDYADLYSQLRRWPELTAEITRLREAAATSIRKCEQYWNEHNIPDAEVHAALELIHSALYAALKEKP